MRIVLRSLAVVTLATTPAALVAQNSVSSALRDAATYNAKNLVAAAQAMPAANYAFKPTPKQWSFAEVVIHIVDDNHITCSGIAGVKPDSLAKPAPTDPKDKIVAALQRSFTECDGALAKLQDAALGDTVTYYGQNASRAAAAIGLVMDWSDHYAQLAMYLRLKGVLPPTARS